MNIYEISHSIEWLFLYIKKCERQKIDNSIDSVIHHRGRGKTYKEIKMSGFLATLIFIFVVTLYLLLIETFYTIFRFTGLNKEKARFQSVSLLTTAGFTTSESEDIVSSPIRRRVAMVAMLCGYMFSVIIASTIINVVIGFVGQNKATNIVNILILALSVICVYFATKSKYVQRVVNNFVKGRIEKYMAKNQHINPLYVLDTHGNFVVCEILITKIPEMLEDKTLVESELRQKYDVSILTLKRAGVIQTMDAKKDILQNGDRLIIFGDIQNIKTVFHSDVL